MSALIGAALWLPAVAFAQDRSTQCRTIGGTWICDTTQHRDIWAESQRQIEAQNAKQAAERQAPQNNGVSEIWARCRKRWARAIEARDFELANALVQGCPAKP